MEERFSSLRLEVGHQDFECLVLVFRRLKVGWRVK